VEFQARKVFFSFIFIFRKIDVNWGFSKKLFPSSFFFFLTKKGNILGGDGAGWK